MRSLLFVLILISFYNSPSQAQELKTFQLDENLSIDLPVQPETIGSDEHVQWYLAIDSTTLFTLNKMKLDLHPDTLERRLKTAEMWKNFKHIYFDSQNPADIKLEEIRNPGSKSMLYIEALQEQEKVPIMSYTLFFTIKQTLYIAAVMESPESSGEVRKQILKSIAVKQ